jgi:hypothetical protein
MLYKDLNGVVTVSTYLSTSAFDMRSVAQGSECYFDNINDLTTLPVYYNSDILLMSIYNIGGYLTILYDKTTKILTEIPSIRRVYNESTSPTQALSYPPYSKISFSLSDYYFSEFTQIYSSIAGVNLFNNYSITPYANISNYTQYQDISINNTEWVRIAFGAIFIIDTYGPLSFNYLEFNKRPKVLINFLPNTTLPPSVLFTIPLPSVPAVFYDFGPYLSTTLISEFKISNNNKLIIVFDATYDLDPLGIDSILYTRLIEYNLVGNVMVNITLNWGSLVDESKGLKFFCINDELFFNIIKNNIPSTRKITFNFSTQLFEISNVSTATIPQFPTGIDDLTQDVNSFTKDLTELCGGGCYGHTQILNIT